MSDSLKPHKKRKKEFKTATGVKFSLMRYAVNATSESVAPAVALFLIHRMRANCVIATNPSAAKLY